MTPPIRSISANPLAPGSDRAKLTAASKQFEAIFVRQMLAEARKADFGGDDLLGGKGLDTFRQMQDERFAEIASESGVFGLAAQIEKQLAARLPRGGTTQG